MESLGRNRLIHRKITSITLALLLGAGGIAALPPTALAAAPSNGTVSSTRSFPKQSVVRADPFQESVSTDVQSDADWGGIETVASWFVLVCRTVLRPSAPSLARFSPPLGSHFVGVRPPS